MFVRKILAGKIRAVDSDRKTVEAVMSDETLDRYDEVIKASAYKKTIKHFMKHPVLLSSHSYEGLRNQIGEWEKVWIDNDKLVGRAKYYVGEGNPEADWAFNLASKGIAAFSVGFIPLEYDQTDWDEYRKAREAGKRIPIRVYTEVDLTEASQVTVPANPSALQRSLTAQEELVMSTMESFENKETLEMEQKSIFGDSYGAPPPEKFLIKNIDYNYEEPEETKIITTDELEAIDTNSPSEPELRTLEIEIKGMEGLVKDMSEFIPAFRTLEADIRKFMNDVMGFVDKYNGTLLECTTEEYAVDSSTDIVLPVKTYADDLFEDGSNNDNMASVKSEDLTRIKESLDSITKFFASRK